MKTISAFKVVLVISASFVLTAVAQPSLGTSALLEGPGAGSASVVLGMPAATNTWTATANAAWLHLDVANQSGMGSTNVVFSFDANPGATRTGTLTIAGQTLTVTQAGSTYVAAPCPVTTLVASGLQSPYGVAVDGAGNVYFADHGNLAIKKWTAASNTFTTLISSGLPSPFGVAVDVAANVYIADAAGGIKKWTATNNTVTTIVASGLNQPFGVAVEGADNVYIADTSNNAIKEWMAANGTVITLVASGLSGPHGVAVDGAGNVYIADTGNNAIKKWTAANNTVSTLVGSGLKQPDGVAADGAGNVYIADSGNKAIKVWSATSNAVTTLVAGLNYPEGVAVDGAGNVYIGDWGSKAIKEVPRAFLDPTAKLEGPAAGSDALPVVLLATANLRAPFTPTSDQAWLTITGITNGVISFAFGANTGGTNRTAHITLLGQPIAITQTPGATQPAQLTVCAGSPAIFSAVTTGGGLTYQWQVSGDSGITFTNISNTVTNAYYTNLAPTLVDDGNQYRVIVTGGGGTVTSAPPSLLTVKAPATASAGDNQTISGTNCITLSSSVGGCATGGVWTTSGSGTFLPNATTLNGTYCPSTADLIRGTVVLTLTSTGPCAPCTNATAQVVVTLQAPPATGNAPTNLAICAGSPAVFSVGATGGGITYQWQVSQDGGTTFTNISGTATNASYTNMTPTLADNGNQYQVVVSASGESVTSVPPAVLTVNAAATASTGGNQTICTGNSTLGLGGSVGGGATGGTWSSSGTGSFAPDTTTLNAIYTPSAADIAAGSVTLTLSTTGQVSSCGPASTQVVVTIRALPAVANPPTNLTVLAGSPAVFTVGATGAGLTYQWQMSQDGGATFTNITNTATNVSYTNAATTLADNGNRYQVIVSGTCPPPAISSPPAVLTVNPPAQASLGASALLEGPGAGSDSVVLGMPAATNTWMATVNAAWLHLDVANQSGTGSTNVAFSFDANPGATRTSTLTIAGQTLTITQAGSTYVAAPCALTTLVGSGLNTTTGLAADGAGNVYFADANNNAIKKWTAANNTVTTLVGSGLNQPEGVAVDGAGNVYFADFANNAIKKWTAASNIVTTLIASGLSGPWGVALDAAGNLYISDSGHNAIKKWTVANNTVTTLIASGLNHPYGVAVDSAGNVYIADCNNNAIKEWTAANNAVTTLVGSGLNQPEGVAVDGAGNVYIADSSNSAIKKWTAADNSVATLVGSGLNFPYSVAVDGAGNVYIADSYHSAIKELPRAFVDPTPRGEGPAAGSDVVPMVLPGTANLRTPFLPTRDQSWLSISGITNGVVSFAVSVNSTGTNRTAYITLLGQPIPITQVGGVTQPAQLTVCAGSPAIFSVAGTGAGLSYQWQVSQDGGMTFTDIGDKAPNASYINLVPTLADNGNQYRVIFIWGGGAITSAPPSVLTVHPATTVNAGVNQTICSGNLTLGLGGTVGGATTSGLWSSSGTGSFVPNATTLNAAYRPSAADIAAGTVTLMLSATGQLAPCPATAQVVVTILTPPTVATPPANLTVLSGWPAVFSAGATGGGLTYQWQVSRDGGTTFTNISATATNASYTNVATLADNGNKYQVIVSGACPPSPASSPAAILTVISSLGATALVEGAGWGNDGVVLAMYPANATWTATADAAWLHLDSANQSGTGSANVVFSYDANPGATRIGTLTIAGQTLTVTQAGSKYVAAPCPVTTLVSSGLSNPSAVAVDRAGNVYVADTGNNAIKKWTPANNSVTTLVASELSSPSGVAVDGAGNVYIADTYHSAVKEWTVANHTVTTLFGSSQPTVIVLDGAGNVYVSYLAYYGIHVAKWTAASQSLADLVSGVNYCSAKGVAVDGAGNVYFSYYWLVPMFGGDGYRLDEWNTASSTRFTLLDAGHNPLGGVALDGAGHVYFTTTNTVNRLGVGTPLVSGLSSPSGLAVDSAGNVFIADTGNNAIKELPRAFVDPTAKWESAAAGSDALPVVLPATANLLGPFAPASDQAWLTITGISNGVVSYAFGANMGSTNRTANITVLGQPISITQTAPAVAISQQPANLTVCAGSPAVFTVTAVGNNLTYQWQVSQDGGNTFTNISATATNASYTNTAPTPTDNGNQYQVVVSGGGASATSAPPAVLTVNAPATASAGANQAICAGSATAALGGTVGGGATGGTWSSSGTGSFAPSATALNATYTPSATDIATGTVTLTLSTTGQLAPCGPATAQVVVTINLLPTASAGANQTICAGSATAGLGGTVGAGATGGTWSSSGTGSFTPNATTLNATYSPSAADITAGTVTLTLTSTGQHAPCGAATAQVVVTIQSPPAITGQPANATVYLGSPAIFTVAATGVGLNYQWQVSADGGTTFTNISDTATNASYTNATTALADDGNQYRVIVGNVCPSQTSTQAVLIVHAVEAWVGTSSAMYEPVICANSQVPLSGALGLGTTGCEWVGAGTFYPSTTTLDVVYTPTDAENSAGSTTVTLIATNPAWTASQASASVTVTIVRPATVSAGANQTVCADSPQTQLEGSVEGAENSEQLGGDLWWWYGAGDFLPDPSVTNAVYIPTAAEIKAGQATLTLAAYGPWPCWEVTSTMTITINPAPTASAGPNQTICAGSATSALGGMVGGGATGGLWTSSGTGTFVPDATTLNAIYTPSAGDAAVGTVTLTMTSAGQQSPCGAASAQVVLTIIPVTVTPPALIGPTLLSNGLFQFAFSNNDLGASFTVLTTTNLSLPLSNWTVAGPATNTAPGLFQFSTDTTNSPEGFYRVRSP